MAFIDVPAAYSWWMDPILERHAASGEIDFGFIDNKGRQKIVQCDEDDFRVIRDKVCRTNTADDHNAVAFKRLADGRLFVAYTDHNINSTMRYRISTDGSVANLGSELTLTASNLTSYSQLETRSNVLWWFTRINNTKWVFRRMGDTTLDFTTDDWDAEQSLLENTGDATQIYIIRRRISNDVIRMFAVKHPTSGSNDLKTFDINLSSGLVYSGSTEYGFLDGSAAAGGATLPADFDELPTFYDIDASTTLRLLDASDDGTLVSIGQWPTSDNGQGNYRVLKLTGADPFNPAHWTAIDVVAHGEPFWEDSIYLGGMVFARESHSGIRVRLAREASGTWYAEQLDSASGNGGDWVTTVLQQSSTQYLLRPMAVRNPGTITGVWQRGPIGTYTDFDTFTHFFVTGIA